MRWFKKRKPTRICTTSAIPGKYLYEIPKDWGEIKSVSSDNEPLEFAVVDDGDKRFLRLAQTPMHHFRIEVEVEIEQ